MLLILAINFSSAQNYDRLATFVSNSYTLTKSISAIESAYDHYIKDSLDENYEFDTTYIDDDNPTSLTNVAFWIIKAISTESDKSVVLAIPLRKQASLEIEEAIDLLVGDGDALRVFEEDDDGPWKCTSSTSACGGCIKFKVNGHVAGCHCVNSQAGNCLFELNGGNPQNWPAWVNAIVNFLTFLFSL